MICEDSSQKHGEPRESAEVALLRVAVDIGGTFTDLVAIDEKSNLYVLKIKTTPKNPEKALIDSITRFIAENNVIGSEIERIIHIGTLGSNLMLGQQGIQLPKTALVTSRGFKDVIEIGRQNRDELYNVFFQRPKPLVPRKLRFEISERVDSHGNVLKRAQTEEIRNLGSKLKENMVEAVAISFINSFINSENENIAKQVLSETCNYVFTSSNVDPEHREYERTSTTVVNAILAPVVSRYLQLALDELCSLGISAPVQIFTSSGGLVDINEAAARPIAGVESGPSAGVVGAAEIAKKLGDRRVLSLDMGGTTAKAGCVVDCNPLLVPEIEVGGRVHMGRVIKGSGYPVRYPSIDLAEVSAGGGTIIWGDELGILKVGPISAGADPGPACYGTGGKNATITDSNLILGRLPSIILNREMRLDRTLAYKSLQRVAAVTDLEVTEAATASIRLVNLQMAKALDIVSLERGHDPRAFSLMAFGGAGPMHAAELAEEVGVRRVIVPPHPGLFSALGMTMTDMKYTYVKGIIKPLEELSEDYCEQTWQKMSSEALSQLQSKVETSQAQTIRSADVRYLGQGFELEIPASDPFRHSELIKTFENIHEAAYGYKHEGERLEITAFRLTITVPVKKPTLRICTNMVPESHRDVWFNDAFVETRVLWRDSILANQILYGPAIIEEYDSTTVVPPGWVLTRNATGCLILELKS